jgi:hypothetical protein
MESDIRLAGYSSEKVDVCSRSNGYMASQLFKRWDDQIFFTHVKQVQRALGDYHGPVMLILDGFNAHHTDAFISEAIDRNICPISSSRIQATNAGHSTS